MNVILRLDLLLALTGCAAWLGFIAGLLCGMRMGERYTLSAVRSALLWLRRNGGRLAFPRGGLEDQLQQATREVNEQEGAD